MSRPIRSTVLALVAVPLLGVAPAAAATSTTSTARAKVSKPGEYQVEVTVRGAAREQVDVFVGKSARRGVKVGRKARKVRLKVRVPGRTVKARVVGRRSRPVVRIAVLRARKRKTTTTTPTTTTPTTTTPTAPTTTTPTTPTAVPSRLVWADEFNGSAGSRPDAGKWTAQTGDGWGNGTELQTYTADPKNLSHDGAGNLAITARREPGVGAHGYTSARMDTFGKFSFTYGRLEARMKVPAGKGLWSQFWALGDDMATKGWPEAGEIDVVETIGSEASTAYAHVHGPGAITGRDYPWGKAFTAPSALSNDFHTYGVVWTPDSVEWFLDGASYAKVTKATMPEGSRWVLDHGFHVLLNLSVGGPWPGAPDASTPFPAQMLVDYVRVYQ